MGVRDIKAKSWTILCRLKNKKLVSIPNPPDEVAKVIQEYIDEVEKKGGFNATEDKKKR
jgi:hypothetical protein